MLDGRDFVAPDDVKAVAVPALAHRLILRPELWVRRISGDDIVRELLRGGADAGGDLPSWLAGTLGDTVDQLMTPLSRRMATEDSR